MTEEIKPNFAFGKILGINEMLYGDIPEISKMIQRLLYCMKETNELHRTSCEFFRLDFRSQTMDEEFCQILPRQTLVLDLKWGCKDELEKLKENE